MKIYIFILGSVILLTACQLVPYHTKTMVDGSRAELISMGDIALIVPYGLQTRPSADVYHDIDNDYNKNDLDQPSEYRIETRSLLNTPCSPSITGASKTTALPDLSGASEWGKVDFFEKYRGEGSMIDYEGDYPVCATSSPAMDRYALCSEKNGKTIVICIHQMTDNPKLAEEIFESFRWTK